MYNILNNIKPVVLKAPAATTAGFNTKAVDRKGFASLGLVVTVGALTAADAGNKLAFTVKESDTLAAADFKAVDPSQLLLNELEDLDAAGNADKAYRAEYIGTKRYVIVTAAETGAFDGVVGVLALLGQPAEAPVGSPGVGLALT